MSPVLSRRRLLVAVACVGPLTGCSVLPAPPAAQIYRLSPPINDPPNQPVLRKRLVVDIPTASESLDTDRIALTRNRTRFDYYADSLWTDRTPVLALSLVRMPDRQMVGQTVITESSPASRNNLDSVVEAFDVAVGKVLVRSVAWTARMMTGKR